MKTWNFKMLLFVVCFMLLGPLALTLFAHPAAAQESITSIEASSATPVEAVSEAQVAAALDNVGVKASTDVASVELPYLGLTEVTSFAKKARLGTMWDSQGRNWALAYVPIQTPLSTWTHEVSDFTAGFAYRINDKYGAAVVGIGIRGNKLTEIISGGRWTIPTVEIQGGYALIAQSGAKPAGVWQVGVAYGYGGAK
ncbi:MAG: hypothetical protein GX410_01600 [Elusimicrobia bacterium]|nr:hypothetical protein [Elusimicrobiota bacterium]